MSAPWSTFQRTDWTPARITKLCNLAGDGISFGAIAVSLGISRNGAIGKFDRLRGEFAGKMLKWDFAGRLADGAELEDIADEAGVSFGAAEAMLAQIRRDLGPQAR